jgi:hypothetical protein
MESGETNCAGWFPDYAALHPGYIYWIMAR